MSQRMRLFIPFFLFDLAVIGVYVFMVFTPTSPSDTSVPVTIEEGKGVSAIASILEEKEVIRSALFFKIHTQLTGAADTLQAGEYTFRKPISISYAITQLSQGIGAQSDVTVKLIEGWTAAEMESELKKSGFVIPDFSERVREPSWLTGSLRIFDGKPAAASLEGYLFPNTYAFFPESTSEEIIGKLTSTLEDSITEEMWEKIYASDYSFYELLTLASIVEKEVRTSEERRIAAGIFFNRLADGHALESDATINYVTKKGTTRASAADLEIQSPYNTYANVGLPPSPISNPGLDAIRAVIEPTQTDYYYFLTTPEGKAIFSKTFNEHLRNKAKYYP